jgi:hypothetical protein
MLIHCFMLFIVLFSSAIHGENSRNSLLEVNEKHEDDELGFDIYGFPSAIVNGCVNIISGEYQQTEMDFSMRGALPFQIQRSYGGAGCKRHSLLYGWQINQGASLLSYQKDSFLEERNAQIEEAFKKLKNLIKSDTELKQSFESCYQATQHILLPPREMDSSPSVNDPIVEKWRKQSQLNIYYRGLIYYLKRFLEVNPEFLALLQTKIDQTEIALLTGESTC